MARGSDETPASRITNEQLQNMFTAMAATITQGISAALQAQNSTTSTLSTHIDPYDNTSLDPESKSGKYQWSAMTAMQSGWKLIAVNVDNADTIMDLFKDRRTQFGFDVIMNVPTSGSGAYDASPRSIAGTDFWNADLSDHKSLLVDLHTLTIDQVKAFSGWFMGGQDAALVASTDMIIHEVNPNEPGNAGLVNAHKIRLRRLSGVLHFILKNHITRSSYNTFKADEAEFLYTHEATRRQHTCGLILLKLAMNVMKPQLVINHREVEKEFENLTLADSGYDLRHYITTAQEKVNQIDTLRPDGVKYDRQRMLTKVFEQVQTAGCKDFLATVKMDRSNWIKDPANFDHATIFGQWINLYTNFKSTGEWDEVAVDKDAQIVALTSELKKEKLKNGDQRIPKKDKATKKAGQSDAPEDKKKPWRTTFVGKITTDPDGKPMKWCGKHGAIDKETGKQPGCYMPPDHDHAVWAKERKAKQEAYEAKKRKHADGDNGDSSGSDKSKKNKMSLSLKEKMRTALVSKIQLSDPEVDAILADIDDTSDTESKD